MMPSNLLVRCIELFIVCFANDHYEQLYKYSCLDWKMIENWEIADWEITVTISTKFF